MRELYRAELSNLDSGVRRLDTALGSYAADTIVVLTSDHGEGFDFARGRYHHGGRLHRDLLHVALFLSGPQVVPRDVTAPVSLVDLMPTLLELVGQSVPSGLDGVSLADAVRQLSAQPQTRPLFAMDHRFYWQAGRRRALKGIQTVPLQIAVIEDDDWCILGREAGAEAWTHAELYDVSADPGQAHDLGATSERLALLRDLVESRLRQWSGDLPAQREQPLDPAVVEQLRSLGYLE